MNAIFNFDAAILLWLQNSFRNPDLALFKPFYGIGTLRFHFNPSFSGLIYNTLDQLAGNPLILVKLFHNRVVNNPFPFCLVISTITNLVFIHISHRPLGRRHVNNIQIINYIEKLFIFILRLRPVRIILSIREERGSI